MSANKRKGTDWEVRVRDYLNARLAPYGVKVTRPGQEGFKDSGDLDGVPLFAIQCKAWQDIQAAIRDGLDGVARQKEYAGKPLGVAIVKRPRRRTAEAYVVMTLDEFTRLLEFMLPLLK